MMKLSKTRFINLIRCNRYAALDEIHRDKEKAVVSFTDDPELEDLISEENKEKISFLLDDMIDEDGEDMLMKKDEQLETLLPYYNKIEVLAGDAIRKRFGGHVIYALNTYDQKRFEVERDGFRLYCFLDGYQEDKDHIRIFEVKATTSKKFIDLEYANDNKEKVGVFLDSPDGILMLAEDLHQEVNDAYFKKVSRLKDRLTKEGRYVYDIAYQRYVFEHAIQTKKKVSFYLVVLNSEYIHDGRLDDHLEPVYGDDIVKLIDVTSLTGAMMPTLDIDVDTVIQRLNMMNGNPVNLGPHCQRKDSRQCTFYPICYKHLPEINNIFTYMGSNHGFKDERGIKHDRFELINEGVVSALDIPIGWIERNNNKIQREVMETDVPYLHPQKIRAGIQTLCYPIYHLDFETFPCPIPRFKGEKPYAQSLFQYSIHIEHAPGVCNKDDDHFGFISTTHEDRRRELIEHMLSVIKDDGGTVLVYNQSFEQTRLKEMAEIYPEFRTRLLDLVDRLFDLMVLLRGSQKIFVPLGFSEEESKTINYYHNKLNGSFSIKKVLPLFSDLDYKGMGIANGTDALVTYARFPLMDPVTFQKKYQELFDYCKQDTWAMVEILNRLRAV